MEAAAAMAIDFNTLSRRELQALCKRNGVRANMTNVAMAEALQALPSVDGIDEIGTTLCLPTPGRSAMKSVMRSAAAADGEDQQKHGSPLPRGRRVSVKSPEAIRMDIEEGEDGIKRDLVKEIVRTPGVALRSTSRRARGTPAPIPTPGTLRRSQRTAGRKATAPVEEHVSMAKGTTRRSARSKAVIDLDQEEEVEVAAAPTEQEKVQEEEPKGAAFDEKCDEPGEEEVTVLLGEGNSKVEEPQQDVEVNSYAGVIESVVHLDLSCDDPKKEEALVVVEEKAPKQQEVAGIDAIVEEIGGKQALISAEKSDPLPIMEDSPILGVLSKAAVAVPVIDKVEEDALAGDGGKDFAERSPVKETTDDETSHVSEDMEVGALGLEEGAVGTDDETCEEDDLVEEDEETTDEISLADLTSDEISEEDDLVEEDDDATDENELTDDESSAEDELVEEEETATDEISQADLTSNETSTEDELGEVKEESLDEMLEQANLRDDETSAKVDVTDVTEVNDENAEQSDSTEEDDVPTGGEDDFSSDLPPEFDNAGNFSGAESDMDTTLPAHVVNASSAAKAAVKSLDDYDVTEELAASGEELVSHQADATEGEVTEQMNEPEATGGAKEKKQLNAEDLHGKSLRKLKAMVKEGLIAAKEGKKGQVAVEGKRLPLAELAGNACVDC